MASRTMKLRFFIAVALIAAAAEPYQDDTTDDEAYVVDTLKDIGRTLKDQFLVIGNHIQNKTRELKQAVGEHAREIKEQLKGLGEQLKKSRDALAKKLFDLFSPAKYSEYNGNIFQTLASLATLREKLQKFITEVHSATGEKWEKLKALIHELRSEIRQKVKELLHGSSATAAYSAFDISEEDDDDDDEEYVVQTIKDIGRTLKDQFLVIGNHIQNKTRELKHAVGEHAQEIKEQLKGLGEQLKKSRDALANKLFDLFNPAKYSEYNGNIFQTLASLATLREKLQKFITEVHSATGEKWEKLKALIHELRSEIRQKVKELLHGSSATAAYSAFDISEEDDDDDDEEYVVQTIKDIGRTLKDQFLVIGNHIQNKTRELKHAVGEHAQEIKEQLKGLGEQLKKSRDALAKKLFDLFNPAKYSEYNGNIFQTLASLATLREKLQKFITEVHSATGEKWEKLKALIHELRSEIRQKVKELLHGSSAAAAYSAFDISEEDDDDDDEEYVVQTIKDIGRTLKDQFLVIGNHIQNKTRELKHAVGEHAQEIKEQLKGLGEQLKKSRDALAKKLFDLFNPAKYSEYNGNIFQTLASLATLREKLQKFITEVHSATGEKWEKLKALIHELRSEIRQKVKELLHGSSAAAAYSAFDISEEDDDDDDEEYVVQTIKDIGRTLKDQFLVIGNHIQNKTRELKHAVGEHAQEIKEQLKGLGEQLKKSRDALAKKLFDLFNPAKYSEYNGNIFQTLASLATLREKLQKFITEVHSATGEKWEKLKALIHELRSEIRQKVKELLHGSSATATYSAFDISEEDDDDDDEEYVVQTIKDIGRTLKDQFLVIGNHIQNKTRELKHAVGEHAQEIKEQLKGLGEQLKKSRDALAKKLFDLFNPAKYSEYNGNIFQTLASLATLREKLQKFITEVHSATGEKWEKLKALIHELRSEIRQKVKELLHGSSATATYSAFDISEEDDDDDDEEYVVQTIKDIGRTLKDQFLVIGNHIQNKTRELKHAVGEHAQEIKEQLKGLGEQLKKSRDALAKKLFDLFNPAKYSEYNGNIFQTLASLATLREKLQKFITEVHSATGEKWEKLKALIHELRSEIRQKVKELLHGSSAPAAYSAFDISEEDDDDEEYVVQTIKDIGRTLKDQFLVIGNHIQNKTRELKHAVGEHAQEIKEQLKGLGEQLKKSRDALAKKLFDLFNPAKYSEYNGNIFQTLASLATLREKLQKFITEVHSATGEKWEKLKALIHELRSEIRQKVKELLHGSSAAAAYSAFDISEEDDDDDDEEYVVQTIKDIGRTLKDQFLVIGNHIQNKTRELKHAVGEHAQEIKEQLKGLGEQLKKSRDALAKKLFDLFNPAKYSEYNGNIFQTLASLATLREKLQKFITEVHSATGEKWEKLKALIHELRSEIRQKVKELLHGSSATATYSAFDISEEDDDDDDEEYVVQTIKDIGRTLKDQFLVIGNHIQNKTRELKHAVGEHAQEIKEQLKGLGEQLKKSRDALAKKLFDLFNPAKYSEYNGNIFQTLASLATLREKLQKFITEVHSATGEKWEKLKALIHELRSEIRQKVKELLHGSSAPAAYSAFDISEEDDDDEEYVVQTIKDIGRTLKDQFLVIGNHIQNKTRELKHAVGEHAQEIKEQLKGLGEQLKKSRDALAKKLFDLFNPAKYSKYNGNIFQTLASLATLREKLQKFITEVRSATGEKWEKLKALIHELRSEIRKKVQELFAQKRSAALVTYSGEDTEGPESLLAQRALSLATRMFSLRWRLAVLLKELEDGGEKQWNDVQRKIDRLRKEIQYQTELYFNRTKPLPALYYASDGNDEAGYVLDALKGVANTLKEKFLVLGEKIKAKLAELRVAAGEQAVLIKKQINELRLQLQQARAQLKKQLFDLFRPAQYASFQENAVIIYEKLGMLREKLRKFLEDIKTLSGEKWEHAKEAIAELRREIKEKVQVLLGEEKKGPATYSAEDSAAKKSVVDTVKDAAATLKEKFQILGNKIRAKVAELRDAVGEHAVTVKQQLESLKSKFNKAHSDLMAKLFDLFRVAQYAALDEARNEKELSLLELKLEQLLCLTGASPAEEWSFFDSAVSELCQEMEAYLKKHE